MIFELKQISKDELIKKLREKNLELSTNMEAKERENICLKKELADALAYIGRIALQKAA